MEKIIAEFHNHSEVKIYCSPAVFQELSDVFSYFIPSAKFHPKYKQRRWDGRIRLMNGRSKTMPYGLMNRLKKEG